MSNWVEAARELAQTRQDYVVVTLAGMRGSAPQIVGSKMLVTSSGLNWGTVGGGKIEAHCIRFAQELLASKGTISLNTWNLQKDIGMSCGGEVTMLFEPQLYSQWVVAIFGAGHVSQELCRVMQTWNCAIRVFDTREEWIQKLPKTFNIKAKISQNLASEVDSLPKGTFLLSMTQGHAHDVPVLAQALKRHEDFAFVGVIGSQIKGDKIRRELKEANISEAAIERVMCPVGMPFGDNTPAEISISIAAQLISTKPQAGIEK